MSLNHILLVLTALCLLAFSWGQRYGRKQLFAGVGNKPRALPRYYGYYLAYWVGLPALLLLILFASLKTPWLDKQLLSKHKIDNSTKQVVHPDLWLNEIKLLANQLEKTTNTELAEVNSSNSETASPNAFDQNSATEITELARYYLGQKQRLENLQIALLIGVVLLSLLYATRRLYGQAATRFQVRKTVENYIYYLLLFCSCVAILTTLGIIFSVLSESVLFFKSVPISEFLFGTHWSPQAAIRSDQVGSSGSFGAIPLFVGTLLISFIAMLIAVPVGLLSAIYLAEYASERLRIWVKPTLELLAGIPTVVYGFFAAITVAPMIRAMGEKLGLSVASESALAAGLVMGVMIIPFVSSLSDDVITAVPENLREGSLGLGATHSETILKVVVPAALPGIVAGILLAVSRAIGETMIVVMAAGLAAQLTINPLEAVTTVTVQIVTLLTGDQEFNSAKTLAAFALALMLFFTTLILNFIALHVVKKYREQYE